jgi:hypothetical protein
MSHFEANNMKRHVALCALMGLFLISTQLQAGDGIQVTWPPPEMKNLPVDYLDRLSCALQLQADRFDDPKTKSRSPVIMVRVGIAALALGQHVDELNAYFEVDCFGWKPSEGAIANGDNDVQDGTKANLCG